MQEAKKVNFNKDFVFEADDSDEENEEEETQTSIHLFCCSHSQNVTCMGTRTLEYAKWMSSFAKSENNT